MKEAIKQNGATAIAEGRTSLGIELGSTRIKAVLIDDSYQSLAVGDYTWENQLMDDIWTYDMKDVWKGLQGCFSRLSQNVSQQYGVALTTVGAMGISAMMHGYLVFDSTGKQLVLFRTWRNTITEEATVVLTEKFQFNIPQRWSIAHLYQAILNKEEHVTKVAHMTTLAGYVHWMLTGEDVLGVGEASGMFPIDSHSNDYHSDMIASFDTLVEENNFPWELQDILPKVLVAGDPAGALTQEGAKLLDPSGQLQPGIPFCPPEGDAGTGMVATNSVAKRTGNVSAGTSVFAMIVLEQELSRIHTEIDMVTTPAGAPVAMVHCNNFTSDFDAWVKLIAEGISLMGGQVNKPALYDALYFEALKGEPDGGGLLAYNYLSGEHITEFDEGRPLLTRLPGSQLSVANLMRTLIFSALGTLRIGMEILVENEHVRLEQLLGHGGFFITEEVGQRMMAAALNVPVAVMDSASEGGAWGIALLAQFLREGEGESLEDYLEQKVFATHTGTVIQPEEKDVEGFNQFMKRYKKGLAIQRAAVENFD